MPSDVVVDYHPHGASRELMHRRDPEIVLSGPAGTGKSRGALEKVHAILGKYPNARALAIRKTLRSLVSSGLVTYRQHVLHDLDGVTFFGGSMQEPAAFRYPNGSTLNVGGMDDPRKVMSTEYDIIYVQEAIELTENDWESCTTRLRNGVVPYQQLIADTNPDAPTHWLKQRSDRPRTGDSLEIHGPGNQTLMLESRHEENPRLYDADRCTWTPFGRIYIAGLDGLTGVRKARLRHGRWVGAEGAVYEEFDRAIHVIDRFDIPPEWRRIRSIDFGFTNPFVCQWWAIDPDGRMYLYREIYMSQRIVADHAIQINALSDGERIEVTTSDHDAEDRATLQAGRIQTVAAQKQITVGIQKVQERLRIAGDGKPRLYIFRDCLVERDELLNDQRKPLCAEQEFDSYVWPKSADGRPVKEVPVDLDNHAMDAMRYAVMQAGDDALPFAWLRNDAEFRARVLPQPETDEERIARRRAAQGL